MYLFEDAAKRNVRNCLKVASKTVVDTQKFAENLRKRRWNISTIFNLKQSRRLDCASPVDNGKEV